LDCIKANDLDDIICVGNSITDVVQKLKDHYDLEVDKIKHSKEFYEQMVTYYTTHFDNDIKG